MSITCHFETPTICYVGSVLMESCRLFFTETLSNYEGLITNRKKKLYMPVVIEISYSLRILIILCCLLICGGNVLQKAIDDF